MTGNVLPPIVQTSRFSRRWMLELLWNLALHRINLRYRETLLGFGWIFLQPVCLTVIFNYIRRVADISTGDVPYPLFAAIGLVAWSFTSLVVAQSTLAVSSYMEILKRVALPKLLLPLSAILASVADLGVMALLLAGLFVYYQYLPPWTWIWIFPIFLAHIGLLVGLGCFLSLLNVFLRDIAQAVPHLLWLWFFASPIFYPSAMVPEEFRTLAKWNPLTGLVEGYRSALLFNQAPAPDSFIPALLVSFLILAVGLACFRRLEGILTDML